MIDLFRHKRLLGESIIFSASLYKHCQSRQFFLLPTLEATVRQTRREPDQMPSDLIKAEGQQRQLLSLTKSSCPQSVLWIVFNQDHAPLISERPKTSILPSAWTQTLKMMINSASKKIGDKVSVLVSTNAWKVHASLIFIKTWKLRSSFQRRLILNYKTLKVLNTLFPTFIRTIGIFMSVSINEHKPLK